MSLISDKAAAGLEQSSWIRRMFEEGLLLKKEHGADRVFDFSLGNPDLPPPPSVAHAMRELADRLDEPYALGYMPNAGYPWAREKLAAHIAEEQNAPVTADDLLLCCGAAGALNVFLRAVLNPGDEVLCFSPYFVEYGAYADNHGGVFKAVPSRADFSPDFDALEKALGPRARAFIINSPNNPTGVIYNRAELEGVIAALRRASERNGRPVYLLSDEPYRFLAYDGAVVPPVLPLYPYTAVAGSFSKNLGLAGERLGYLAASPALEGREQLMAALITANRTLGFVNPPAVGQRLMAAALGSQVDLSVYERRRNAVVEVLKGAGYSFRMPQGAFYIFPEAPGGDDVAFVRRLQQELVLGVPGSGFGRPGHFRLSFCVDEDVIRRSADAFARAAKG